MASNAHGMRTSAIALGVALTIHSAATIAILRIRPRETWWHAPEAPPVEIEVANAPVPPPQSPVDRPEPVVRPRIVARPRAAREPARLPASSVLPPPTRQPPVVPSESAPPVFGVTTSSVVSGEAAMTVPVGNTTMTGNRSARATPTPPRPYASDGRRPFAPVPEIYIATQPRKLYEVNGADIYPPEPRSLGIEGTVKLGIDLDEKGNVVGVRLIQRAGHGFDEVAARAMPKFRFSPALTSDGRAVPCRFTYQFRFTIGD